MKRKELNIICPHCGKEHELKYEYNGITLLACPEVEPDTIYSYKANWFGGIFNPKFNNYDMRPLEVKKNEP